MQQQFDEAPPLFGKNAVVEFLKNGGAADTVWLSDALEEKTAAYYTALAKQAGAVVKTVRAAKLDAVCNGQRHQGIVAFAAQVEYCELQDILDKAAQTGRPPFVLLADGVEDPHNLGALMRSALLCGVHGIVIPKRGAAAVTPIVMKASAGAAALLPVARVANIGEAVRSLKKQNVFVYGADMGAPSVFSQNLTGAVALVVGNEGKGVSPLVKKLCDGGVSLPMAPGAAGVDSFNVSVAGGILMYEIFRQQSAGKGKANAE